jgi:hypothetical protein
MHALLRSEYYLPCDKQDQIDMVGLTKLMSQLAQSQDWPHQQINTQSVPKLVLELNMQT